MEKIIQNENYPINCNEINKTLLDLYVHKKNEDTENFIKKLYNCKYKICNSKIINLILNILNDKELNWEKKIELIEKYLTGQLFSASKQIIKTLINIKKKQKNFSYIFIYDPDYNNTTLFGLKPENNKIVISFPFEKNICSCVGNSSKYFKINDETQENINHDFENIDNKYCNLKGLLLPFLWKYIDQLKIYDNNEKELNIDDYLEHIVINNNNNKNKNKNKNNNNNNNNNNKFYNALNNENHKKIILNKKKLLVKNNNKLLFPQKYIIHLNDYKYSSFKSISKIFTKNDIHKINCKDFIIKMFGSKIVKNIFKFSKRKKLKKTNTKININKKTIEDITNAINFNKNMNNNSKKLYINESKNIYEKHKNTLKTKNNIDKLLNNIVKNNDNTTETINQNITKKYYYYKIISEFIDNDKRDNKSNNKNKKMNDKNINLKKKEVNSKLKNLLYLIENLENENKKNIVSKLKKETKKISKTIKKSRKTLRKKISNKFKKITKKKKKN